MVRRWGFGFGLGSAVCRPIANSGAVVQGASRVYSIVLLITIIIDIVYFVYFINRIQYCIVLYSKNRICNRTIRLVLWNCCSRIGE